MMKINQPKAPISKLAREINPIRNATEIILGIKMFNFSNIPTLYTSLLTSQ